MDMNFYFHIIIFIFNCLFLILNIIYLIFKMGGRGSELNIFKFSDNFNVIFMKKTYEEIVFYLNNKYENLFSKKKKLYFIRY
jgi:hypothetical protein